jgi:DNA replication ATP-dependent helicase Dna2
MEFANVQVKNPEARRGGLDVSLFKLLSEKHPQAVVDLSYQYRMNEDIMLLSNRLVYEDRLKCGSDQVAKQGLVIPNLQPCSAWCDASCGCDCWVRHLMKEEYVPYPLILLWYRWYFSVKAVFVDTDKVPALDSRVGDLVQNETEGELVHQLATGLTASGISEEDIAVITPYRQQIKLLANKFGSMPGIEILTADKSQGRDKDCIFISLVRSNDLGNVRILPHCQSQKCWWVDWRIVTRLETNQCIFHQGQEEINHFRIGKYDGQW